jgi:hypothetical protein
MQKREAEAEASTRARAAAAVLETAELDDLIGRCQADRLEAARTAAATAHTGHARAVEEMRQAERRSRQLSEVLARFEPERVAAKVQDYHARTRELAPRLLALLGEAAEVSEALHAIFMEAEAEFPQFYLPVLPRRHAAALSGRRGSGGSELGGTAAPPLGA